ncbi:MAG: hypothetical protein Q9195_006056 [Heterodermia aff. obscurata]
MSGIEVTGIVLGAIPLLISALEHYAEGLHLIRRWLRYKRELKSLIRLLRAEHSRFLGTCERVLYGLVTVPERRLLIDQPGSSHWKDLALDQKLRQRLQHAYTPYMESIDDMTEAIEDLRDRLNLDVNLQVSLGAGNVRVRTVLRANPTQPPIRDEGSFKVVFKAIKYAVSQRMFDESVERIRYNNTILADLTSQNIELEPLRLQQRCPVSKHLKAVQHHARSLYRVIEKSWQCQCSTTHSANLCLDARLVEDIALQTHERLNIPDEDMKFDVVFSSDSTSTHSLPWSWRETTIRLVSIKDAVDPQFPSRMAQNLVTPTRSYVNHPIIRAHRAIKSKTLRFMPEPTRFSDSTVIDFPTPVVSTPKSSSATTSGSLLSQEDLSKLKKINSLCRALIPQNEHCLGYLSPGERHALTLHCAQDGASRLNRRALISFTELMAPHPRSDKLPLARGNLSLSWAERLEIALTVASSILQLQQTPWLRDDWTKEDLSLCKDCTDETKQHVLVSKAFPATDLTDSSRAAKVFGLPRNKTLFALGIFLIELCLGEAFESLRSPQDPLDANGHTNILTDLSAADRLTKHIYGEVGDRYGDVVRRCIHCDFNQRSINLEDDNFRQAVYEGVITPLQANAREFRSEYI